MTTNTIQPAIIELQPGAATATQVVHPWRATLRTALQFVIALAAGFPLIVGALGEVPPWLAPALAAITAVAAAITRVMAIPEVNAWLAKVGLGAQPKAETELAAATSDSAALSAGTLTAPNVNGAVLVGADDPIVLPVDRESPPYPAPAPVVGEEHDPDDGDGRHAADEGDLR